MPGQTDSAGLLTGQENICPSEIERHILADLWIADPVVVRKRDER